MGRVSLPATFLEISNKVYPGPKGSASDNHEKVRTCFYNSYRICRTSSLRTENMTLKRATEHAQGTEHSVEWIYDTL